MRDVSGPTLTALQHLRQTSAYTADLCASVILGGDANRHNALRLIVPALRELIVRAQKALDALEAQP
jgi:hypothetical protein